MTKCEITLSQRIWIRNTYYEIIYIYIYIYAIYIYTDTHIYTNIWTSLLTQHVKNPPAVWETWVWSLGWEDPLEKGMATHSSILAWRISWTVHGVTKRQTQLRDFQFTSLHIYICIYKAFLIHFNISCSGSQEILKWIRNAFLLEETIPRQYTNFLFLKF